MTSEKTMVVSMAKFNFQIVSRLSENFSQKWRQSGRFFTSFSARYPVALSSTGFHMTMADC